MAKGPTKQELAELGIHYRCPVCYRINGEHTDDCVGKMMGDGITDPEERIRVMRAAICDLDDDV